MTCDDERIIDIDIVKEWLNQDLTKDLVITGLFKELHLRVDDIKELKEELEKVNKQLYDALDEIRELNQKNKSAKVRKWQEDH